MAKTSARSAQLAKLKLQQAEKRAQIKQRQIQEQIEQELHDLQDQAEYSQSKPQLLAADQIDDRCSSQGDERAQTKKSVPQTTENMRQGLISSTPKGDTVVYNTISRVGVPEETETSPPLHHMRVRDIEQDLTTTLVEMNKQLVGAVKQSSEATAVMKSMLQRQGVPRPQPTKFKGDPAQFPVFTKRVQNWLSEKGFTEREKITHLLSFVEGNAKDAIEHCEIKENGYSEALKILESQYGHPASVVTASLKQITVGPRIEKGNDIFLTKLRNNLCVCLDVLRDNKKYEHEINASSNIERVIDRLPTCMQGEWAKGVPKICDETESGPTLRHVLELLDKQLRIMKDPQYGYILTTKRKPINSNDSKSNGSNSSLKNKFSSPRYPPPEISTMTTNVQVGILDACSCCGGKHSLINCKTFAEITPENRWQIVRTSRLCHLCFAAGHMKAQCTSTDMCDCKAKSVHHRPLHRKLSTINDYPELGNKLRKEDPPRDQSKETDESRREDARKLPDSESKGSQQEKVETYTTLTQQRQSFVLLHVVPIKVFTQKGHAIATYGLLDTASRGTIIDTDLARRLNARGPVQSIAVTTVLGTQNCKFEVISLSLQSAAAREDDPILEVSEGLVKKMSINEKILPHEIDQERYPHLAAIKMPDVDLKQVSIIIGENVKGAHIVQEVRVSEDPGCDLYTMRTALGWTIAGRTQGTSDRQTELSVNFFDTDRQMLNRQVERFWEIETAGLQESDSGKATSVEDRRAERILERSTRLVAGHYETGLLWKEDNPCLPDNRVVAERRLHYLKKKFRNNPQLEQKYRQVMQDYIDRGLC